MRPPHWRVLRSEPASGAWNMAVDETLMHHVRRSRDHVMRVYTWAAPTLSFGRNQSVIGRYDRAGLETAGVACVRRPTGGRAVLHHREITYAVVAPATLGSMRESYERINRLLLAALERLGVHASVATGQQSDVLRSMSNAPTPCFDLPSKGELVFAEKKLVGSAQWRDRDVLLQHGSILTADDQSRIHDFLSERAANRMHEPATLGQLLGRQPDPDEVCDALEEALRSIEDSGATQMSITEMPAAELNAAFARYNDSKWTWKR